MAAKEIGRMIGTFSGKAEELDTFVIEMDQYHSRYGATRDQSLNEYVYFTIKSKLLEKARDFVRSRPDLRNWSELRTALTEQFGDRTNREILTNEFQLTRRQHNEDMLSFLNRIRKLKARIDLKIQTDPLMGIMKDVARGYAESMAIMILKSNAPSELELRLGKPTTLNEAANIITEYLIHEKQISSLRGVNTQTYRKPILPPRPIQGKPHVNNSRHFGIL
ncbi:uncharacterized protein LOC107270779 [Cephus cinctus]|uniref:Uncharacterized protein LOC107270779 n=1 Tax=Cephus cinctus TaxID=211228 RepID=A0AAJ7C4C8_CEPCN|nr:uncharacterized protein LOC107270779 [Cephus cinctus]